MKPLIVGLLLLVLCGPAWGERDTDRPMPDESGLGGKASGVPSRPDYGPEPVDDGASGDHEPPDRETEEPDQEAEEPEYEPEDPISEEDQGIDWGWDE